MKEESLIQRLAARARMENLPEVDVRGQVMANLRAMQGERSPLLGPLAWVAGISLAAASLMVWIAATSWEAWTDPLLSLLIDTPWGLL